MVTNTTDLTATGAAPKRRGRKPKDAAAGSDNGGQQAAGGTGAVEDSFPDGEAAGKEGQGDGGTQVIDNGGQQQGGGEEAGNGSQDSGSNETKDEGPKLYGLKRVTIEEDIVPARGGRQLAEEVWPFGDLTPSVETEAGIKGPSFFIPEAENPDAQLASARKRHKGVSFISRKSSKDGVEGVRVWRSPIDV